MSTKIKCPVCRRSADSSYTFCPYCGEPLHAETDDAETGSDDAGDDSGRSRGGCRAFFVSLLLVLLTGAAALAGYYYFTISEPEIVVITDGLRRTAAAYSELGEFYHGVAQGKRDGQTFYFDTRGQLLDASAASRMTDTHTPDESRLQRVEQGGKWGMINRDTRDTVIRPIYSTLGAFYDGLALATIKYGDPSMPEFCCFYGYVDTRGAHTFTPEQFAAVELARSNAERREYLASLPHGVTLQSLGLPQGLSEVTIRQDSLGRIILKFDRRGILTHCAVAMRGMDGVTFGVADGFVTSMTTRTDGMIRHYRYLREAIGDHHDAVIRQGSDGRRKVGDIEYSADDGTVTAYSLDWLPALSAPGVTYTSRAY